MLEINKISLFQKKTSGQARSSFNGSLPLPTWSCSIGVDQTMEVWPSKLQEKEQNGSSLHLTKYTEINCSKGLVTSTTTQTRRHIDLRHGLSHQNPLVPLGLLCLLGFQDLGVGIGTSFWGSGADRPRRALTFTTQEAGTSVTTQEVGSLHQEWIALVLVMEWSRWCKQRNVLYTRCHAFWLEMWYFTEVILWCGVVCIRTEINVQDHNEGAQSID